MYCDYLHYFGNFYELMVCLPQPAGAAIRLLFSRGSGPDFSERERGLLMLLRPHLHQALRARRRQAASITPRQRQRVSFHGRTVMADGTWLDEPRGRGRSTGLGWPSRADVWWGPLDEGHARRSGIQAGAATLIRPDGFVGWALIPVTARGCR